MSDGNIIGHNVFEIGEIEIESLFKTTRIRAAAVMYGHRMRAEPPK